MPLSDHLSRVHCEARKGFTLLEALIAISVLAVLFFLLLGSLGRVREASAQTKCVSQLRQVGAALLILGGDNQMKISSGLAGVDVQTAHLWSHKLWAGQYLPQKEALRCPSGSTDIAIEHSGWAWQVYGLNMFGTAGRNETSITAPKWRYTLNLKELSSPARYPLVADSAAPSAAGTMQTFRIIDSVPSGLHLRHQGKANICFADGHIETLSADALAQGTVPLHIPLYQD